MTVEPVLPDGTLVVGDLHLDVWAAEPPAGFVAWLDALHAPRLVVLGDLFDAWVGRGHARVPAAAGVLDALRRANARGVPVDVLHGNRDFLLGADFERRSAARVHPAGFAARLARPDGPRALLLHGDELCVNDRRYQCWRAFSRSGPVRGLARAAPPAALLAAARGLRALSRTEVGNKDPKTLEQDAGKARELLEAAGAEVLACGHAHAFRDEALGGGLRLVVVDDFGGGDRDALRVTPAGGLEACSSGFRGEAAAPA